MRLIRYESENEARSVAKNLLRAMNHFYEQDGKVSDTFFKKYENARSQVAKFDGDLSDLTETEALKLKFVEGQQ